MERGRERVRKEGTALVVNSSVLFTIIISGRSSKAYRIVEKYERALVSREFYEDRLKEAYVIAEKFDPKGLSSKSHEDDSGDFEQDLLILRSTHLA
ncbi:MAG: hypothetical protein HA496_03585 [Thaumarchaeota archaeon]|jgi:predicted nucleic acid-binding protein|nr:hypothetical protein [Nitrososphaerota archaeon]